MFDFSQKEKRKRLLEFFLKGDFKYLFFNFSMKFGPFIWTGSITIVEAQKS